MLNRRTVLVSGVGLAAGAAVAGCSSNASGKWTAPGGESGAGDGKGIAVTQNSTFATIKPAGVAGVTFQANPMVSLKDGGMYGVGQPAIVYFSKTIKDRAAAEQAMEVVTEPSVEGRWHWVTGQS